MNDKRPAAPAPAMSIGDIYYILFRQKWLILSFSVLGIVGAVVLLLVIKPPQYLSEAELSIQYVVEARPLTAPGEEPNTVSVAGRDGIITTEGNILHSLDLAEQVVQILTPQRILNPPGKSTDTNQAALFVRRNLTVESTPGSSDLRITFQHPDPTVAQEALRAILDAYFIKHVQMHQGMQLAGGFLTNEVNRVQGELAQTEEALRQIKIQAGVLSVDDTKKSFTTEISEIKQSLFSAQVELAGHVATVKELTKDYAGAGAGAAVTNANSSEVIPIPAGQIDAYKAMGTRLDFWRKKEQDYLSQGFTDENVLLKEVRAQITDIEKRKRDLETTYPKLASIQMPLPGPAASQPGGTVDLQSEYVQVAALQSKIASLNAQLSQVWTEATNFENVESTILDLQQKKDLEEANLKYFASNLAQDQFNAAQGEDKASGIKMIQEPSFPTKGWSKQFKKKVAIVGVGGIAGGLALAFLFELFLDRSVRRPLDFESKLRLPLLISIPDTRRNRRGQRAQVRGKKRPLLNDVAGNGHAVAVRNEPEATIAPWDRAHSLRKFYEGLRDRLIVHFETRNQPTKPKLVAVTSCGRGAGVSSIAAGLAATLSETGDGNVLLVNISGNQGAAQQFHKGRPGTSLDVALESDTMKNALVGGSLYIATEQADNEQLPSTLPKRLTGLMPKLKGSDYDYIIFDMPPVTQTSITPRLSGLMDMVLLVIESEKTNQDVVQRVNQLLGESKANVSTVLNKVRTYVPARLHQEFLNDV